MYNQIASEWLGITIYRLLFWAHTSHRMYLEPYLMILAASALVSKTTYGGARSSGSTDRRGW